MELRPYQRAAVDSIYSYFEKNKTGNGIIVAPTASGKSPMQAKFCQEVLEQWPNQKILLLAHVKELLQQNAEKLLHFWPAAPIGIYSAGLKSRQLGRKITIAGIQSVYNKAKSIGWVDLISIDEVHLLPAEGEGMYRTLIAGLKQINPRLRLIGWTATPYRTKTGMLVGKDNIFTDIMYEIEVADLVKQGYLCPLISKSGVTQADLTNVKKRGEEFIQGEAEIAFDKESLTQAAIDEMEQFCKDRKSWIVFCQGVGHAHHVAEALNARGHSAKVVVGETDDMFRAATINEFKRGELKCLVNCNVFSTGFDAPNVDAVILLRAIGSTGMYTQILGRGMRLHAQKTDCIVLDFGGNIERHGPIDEIKIKKKRGAREDSDREVHTAPVKICPKCRLAVPAATTICGGCGHEFIIEKPIHETVASFKPVMSLRDKSKDHLPQRLEVKEISYLRNEGKMGKPPSMRVVYLCSTGNGNLQTRRVMEWVCVEHRNMRDRVVRWWLQMKKEDADIDIPITVDQAVARAYRELKKPSAIWVEKDGEWDRVISREFPAVEAEETIAEQDNSEVLRIEKLQEEMGF